MDARSAKLHQAYTKQTRNPQPPHRCTLRKELFGFLAKDFCVDEECIKIRIEFENGTIENDRIPPK